VLQNPKVMTILVDTSQMKILHKASFDCGPGSLAKFAGGSRGHKLLSGRQPFQLLAHKHLPKPSPPLFELKECA
jgi:hypothetical protein